MIRQAACAVVADHEGDWFVGAVSIVARHLRTNGTVCVTPRPGYVYGCFMAGGDDGQAPAPPHR